MARFRIPFQETQWGFIEIEANSIEEALENENEAEEFINETERDYDISRVEKIED
jgi:hypothetical protein